MKLTSTNRKGLTWTVAAIMLSVCILCMSSCVNDELDGNRFMIQPEFSQQSTVTISTKALPSGYNNYSPAQGDIIYAYAYHYKQGDNAITPDWVKGSFRNTTGNTWNSSLEVEQGHSYRVFAFNPGGASNTSGTISVNNGEYQLVVSPMKIITSGDPSISVASARSYAENRNPELTLGNFDMGQISFNNLERDKVCLAMNHLYSKATPQFKMDDYYVYYQLRTIVITSVKAITAMGSSSMTVNFAANPNPQWGTRSNDSIKIELLNEGDSIILNTSAFQPVNSFCYMPVTNLPVSLEVTYNVYQGTDPLTDQNSGDRLIKTRRNCVAKNSKILPSGEGIPKAGTNYTINITVMPTYLYQLTDDDLQMELTVQQTP